MGQAVFVEDDPFTTAKKGGHLGLLFLNPHV
jgi:hypothetical protein